MWFCQTLISTRDKEADEFGVQIQVLGGHRCSAGSVILPVAQMKHDFERTVCHGFGVGEAAQQVVGRGRDAVSVSDQRLHVHCPGC